MQKEQHKVLKLAKQTMLVGVILGFIAFVLNFFVSEFIKDYLLLIGVCVVSAAVTLFLLGVFFCLMIELTGSSVQNRDTAS